MSLICRRVESGKARSAQLWRSIVNVDLDVRKQQDSIPEDHLSCWDVVLYIVHQDCSLRASTEERGIQHLQARNQLWQRSEPMPYVRTLSPSQVREDLKPSGLASMSLNAMRKQASSIQRQMCCKPRLERPRRLQVFPPSILIYACPILQRCSYYRGEWTWAQSQSKRSSLGGRHSDFLCIQGVLRHPQVVGIPSWSINVWKICWKSCSCTKRLTPCFVRMILLEPSLMCSLWHWSLEY